MDASQVTAAREFIENGQTALGVELGSTRIKAVLVGPTGQVLASGSHGWENQLVDGLWSYDLEDVWAGVQGAYADLREDVSRQYGTELTRIGGGGVSAMMHGYLAFNSSGELLVPFRTWRNVNTGAAVEALTAKLDFNFPHRWSVAHLYQAVLDREEHVPEVVHITTLAGLVHERLTGREVLGVGDASGMFPIDAKTGGFDAAKLAAAEEMFAEAGFSRPLVEVLPEVLSAGEDAGTLTQEGARLLDPSGALLPGAPFCPPEGDAGTGMVATNAVAPRTGNVSAGTSIFAMVVLERPLRRVHLELDMVTTPDGSPVAMAHSNNGASEWDQWAGVFRSFAAAAGTELETSELYDLLYAAALNGDPAGGGLVAYNFLSGEPILDLEAGRPLYVRSLTEDLSFQNFMRAQLMSIFGVLRVGVDILLEEEKVALDRLYAHGGLFKTPVVAQKVMAAALRTPVAVSETAAEGGAWGIALLALYRAARANGSTSAPLPQFLNEVVFKGIEPAALDPDPADVAGFNTFLARYLEGLPVARVAAEVDQG